MGSREALLDWLRQSPLLERLTSQLWDALSQLSQAHAATGGELHEKFVQVYTGPCT